MVRGAPLKESTKPGRKPIPIDEKRVYEMARIGCSNREIGLAFSCSDDTIERRCAGIVRKARSEFYEEIRKLQLDACRALNPTMLIWSGKQHLKQSDAPVDEDGKPTEVRRIVFDAGGVDSEYEAKVRETLAEVDRQIANSATEELPASESD